MGTRALFSTGILPSKFTSTTTGTPSAPVNTVAPALSGDFFVGQTLTCSTGSWTGFPAPTYTYQWRNAGVDIGGATSSTYVLQASDDGDSITCNVTATNASGSASQVSNAFIAIQTRLFLDADDPATVISSGGTVSQWSDKSGNASNFTNANVPTQPSTGVVTINSRNTVSSNATAGVTLDGGGTSLRDYLAAGSYDVYIVYVRTVDQGGRLMQVSSGATAAVTFTLNANGNVAMNVGGTATTTTGSDDLLPHLYYASATNSLNTIDRDGATQGTQATVSVPVSVTQVTRLFRDFNDLNRLAAGIGEIIVCRNLSSAEETQMLARVASKWGITV